MEEGGPYTILYFKKIETKFASRDQEVQWCLWPSIQVGKPLQLDTLENVTVFVDKTERGSIIHKLEIK